MKTDWSNNHDKEDDFIEDIKALCKQYWGKKYRVKFRPRIPCNYVTRKNTNRLTIKF